jgi:hypothetical protein
MKTNFLLVALAVLIPGCTSYESAYNAHQAREYLTEDIEDQIVFNLIRARNGLPFAHYDVSNVQSIVGQKVTPSIGGSRSGVSNGYQPKVTVAGAVRSITRGLTGGLGGERNNSVTVTIAPIFDKPQVYANYVAFLNSREKPDEPGDSSCEQVETRALSAGFLAITAPEPAPTPTPTPNRTGLDVVAQTETTKTDSQGRLVERTVETKANKAKPDSSFPPVRFGAVYSLRECRDKPKNGFVPGTVRRWGDAWYYVPLKYTPEFSRLCLSLVARGDGGPTATTDEATSKKLDLFNSQLQQQNTILQTR